MLEDAASNLVSEAVGGGGVESIGALEAGAITAVGGAAVGSIVGVGLAFALFESKAVLTGPAGIVGLIEGTTIDIVDRFADPLERELSSGTLLNLGVSLEGHCNECKGKE